MSILHPDLKRKSFLFWNQTKINHWGVSRHVSVDRVIQLANSFWTPGRWQQPLPRNHGDAVTVGTLWGLGQVCGGTSRVMYRAAKKVMYFFFETYIHSHATDASSDMEPESNLLFPSAFDSYFYSRCWICVYGRDGESWASLKFPAS